MPSLDISQVGQIISGIRFSQVLLDLGFVGDSTQKSKRGKNIVTPRHTRLGSAAEKDGYDQYVEEYQCAFPTSAKAGLTAGLIFLSECRLAKCLNGAT